LALDRPIHEYPSIQTWIQGLTEQWGEPPSDLDDRLRVVESFCRFVDGEPDRLITESSRDVESGKRIRIKVRRHYSERIAEFQSTLAGDARTKARAANIVRSFFIHNGIFMQAGLQE